MRRRSRRNEIVEAYDIIMTRRLCALVILLVIILSVALYIHITRPEPTTSRTVRQASQTKVIKKATSSQQKTSESTSSEELRQVYDVPQEQTQTGSIETIEEPKQADSSSNITEEQSRQQLEAEEGFESNQELEIAVDGAESLEDQNTATDKVDEEEIDDEVVESANQESQEETYTESTSDEKYISAPAGQGLYRIAVNNGLTLDQLLDLNPGLTPNSSLSPGQQVRVR